MSTEDFFWRGRGRSFHVEEPKTEKARELTVESLVRGIWRLRDQKQSGEYGRVCKVEDSHKHKTTDLHLLDYQLHGRSWRRRSSVRDLFIAESVSLVLNFLCDWKPVVPVSSLRM